MHLPPEGHHEIVYLYDCQADYLPTSLLGFGGSHFVRNGAVEVRVKTFLLVTGPLIAGIDF